MLRKVASLVKPIMVKHGYHVGVLSELHPTDHPNLLGLNHDRGREINLRLRQPYDPSVFLDIEQEVVGTMLHELTHNEYGDHDHKFHAHLKSLEREYDILRASGYNGEGFYSQGLVLGAGPKNAFTDLRQRAIITANQKRQSLYAGSGQRLGSGTNGAAEQYRSLRKAMARAAAIRAMNNKDCGTRKMDPGQGQLCNRYLESGGIRTDGREDDKERRFIAEAVRLIEEMEREEQRQNGGRGGIGHRAGNFEGSWQCLRCTLVNPGGYLQCEACDGLKPVATGESSARASNRNGGEGGNNQPSKALGNGKGKGKIPVYNPEPVLRLWTCHRCGVGNEELWWTCTKCGTMKLSS
ncbi:hypothetical protein RUND412_010639 [Rhizina undulata]